MTRDTDPNFAALFQRYHHTYHHLTDCFTSRHHTVSEKVLNFAPWFKVTVANPS
eukprot:m.9792 g.9792  ORF g.9792 m.9792 type:complete len:54 (-) comp5492_c0_seq2:208-369(-)